jgi:hypothetical protein
MMADIFEYFVKFGIVCLLCLPTVDIMYNNYKKYKMLYILYHLAPKLGITINL